MRESRVRMIFSDGIEVQLRMQRLLEKSHDLSGIARSLSQAQHRPCEEISSGRKGNERVQPMLQLHISRMEAREVSRRVFQDSESVARVTRARIPQCVLHIPVRLHYCV